MENTENTSQALSPAQEDALRQEVNADVWGTAAAVAAEPPSDAGAGDGETHEVDGASQGDQDPWASAPAVLREQFEAEKRAKAELEQKYRSELGRQKAYQQRYEQERAAAEELRKQVAARDKPAVMEKWDAMREEFTPIAEGVEEFVRTTVSGDLEKVVDARLQQRETQLLLDAVSAHVGVDVEELVVTDDWKTWFQAQPHDVQMLGYSPRLRDAKAIVDRYLSDQKAARESAEKAARLAAKRSTALSRSTAVEGIGTAERDAGDISEDELRARIFKEVFST